MRLYGSLQQLGLISAWPLLPNPFQQSYFFALLPPRSLRSGNISTAASGLALLTSPFAMLLCLEYLKAILDEKLTGYTRAAIPRPDNPDAVSLRPKSSDGVKTSASPVQEYPTMQGSLRDELRKDWSKIVESFYVTRAVARQFVRSTLGHKRPAVEFPDEIEEIELSPRQSSRGLDIDAYAGDRAQSPDLGRFVGRQPTPSLRQAIGAVPQGQSMSSVSSVSSFDEPGSPTIQGSNVQIRTRTGSTSTLHMDVEINAPVAGGVPLTSSFSSSPRTMVIDNAVGHLATDPHYRVTSLTLAPSSMLGSRIKDALIAVVRLPLESIFLRSLACAYLDDCAVPGRTAWLRSQIYPVGSLMRPTFGFTSWPTAFDYLGKVFLCVGIDMILDLELWHVMSAMARWIGRRSYSWGHL